MKQRLFVILIFLLSYPPYSQASDMYFCITQETHIYSHPNEQSTPVNSTKPGEAFVYLHNVYSDVLLSREVFAEVIINNEHFYILYNHGQISSDPNDCDAISKRVEKSIRRGKEIMEEQENKRAAEEKERIAEKKRLEKQRAEKAALARRKRQQTIESAGKAKGWSTTCITSIINRKIYIGMTSEMVLLSWGSPERKNRTITANGIHEQWVYSLHEYVYFQNGVVTAIQTSK